MQIIIIVKIIATKQQSLKSSNTEKETMTIVAMISIVMIVEMKQ